jgi:hypothetical protein
MSPPGHTPGDTPGDIAGARPDATPVSRFAVRALIVLWPAFFTAGVAEMLIFGLVDPQDLRWFGGEAITLSRQAIYTLAFLVLWCLIGAAAAVTLWLGSARRGDAGR